MIGPTPKFSASALAVMLACALVPASRAQAQSTSASELSIISNMAQTAANWPMPGARDAAGQLRSFIDPEIQLAREIGQSLANLERSCTLEGAMAPQETAVDPSLSRAIEAAQMELSLQASLLDAQLKLFADARGIGRSGVCAMLPESWRISDECSAYQASVVRHRLVRTESARYYKTIEYKYRIYLQTQTLESRGCTRAGFTRQLWQADQKYLLPRLKMSSEWFSQVLGAR